MRTGRPPKRAANKRSVRLQLKLTAAERALIVKASGGEPTVWAREVVLRAARAIVK